LKLLTIKVAKKFEFSPESRKSDFWSYNADFRDQSKILLSKDAPSGELQNTPERMAIAHLEFFWDFFQ
jgi:hypothetical protein